VASAQGQRLDTHRSGLCLCRLQHQDDATGQGESMTERAYLIEVSWGDASVRLIHLCERVYDMTTKRQTAFDAVSDIWFMGRVFDESEFDTSNWNMEMLDIAHGGLVGTNILTMQELAYLKGAYIELRQIYNAPDSLLFIDKTLDAINAHIKVRRTENDKAYDHRRWRQ
jgi:hypothetical protein